MFGNWWAYEVDSSLAKAFEGRINEKPLASLRKNECFASKTYSRWIALRIENWVT